MSNRIGIICLTKIVDAYISTVGTNYWYLLKKKIVEKEIFDSRY